MTPVETLVAVAYAALIWGAVAKLVVPFFQGDA